MANEHRTDIPWSLIAAELGGSLEETPAAVLRAWRAASPDNEACYQQARRVWDLGGQLGPEFPFDSHEDWPHMAARLKQVPTLRRRHLVWRWAAVVALLLGLGLALRMELRDEAADWQEVTATDKAHSLTLPDGSQITLRAGARLRYPSHFDTHLRTIELEGEAWLEVAATAQRLFRVQGPDVQVVVLGTAFALRDLPGDGTAQVDLTEGRVQLSARDTLSLAAGQSALLRADSLLMVGQNPHFLAWRQQELRFDAAPLSEVLPALSRYYERPFGLATQADPRARLTATFRWETAEEAVAVLETALGVAVELGEAPRP
ncbi:MAG: hypothetical protein OHK0039_31840 [Bacteroidia bacterium]